MEKDKKLEEEILSIIKEILEKEVNLEDKIEDIPEWDSLKHLQIILEIEERTGKTIPMDKIGQIVRVEDLVKLTKGDFE